MAGEESQEGSRLLQQAYLDLQRSSWEGADGALQGQGLQRHQRQRPGSLGHAGLLSALADCLASLAAAEAPGEEEEEEERQQQVVALLRRLVSALQAGGAEEELPQLCAELNQLARGAAGLAPDAAAAAAGTDWQQLVVRLQGGVQQGFLEILQVGGGRPWGAPRALRPARIS